MPSKMVFDEHRQRQKFFNTKHPEDLRIEMLRPFAGSAEHGHAFRQTTPGQVLTPNDDYQYLIRPFTVEINMGFYDVKDVKNVPYRLNVAVLISAIQLNVYPELINDLTQIMSYFEGQMIIPMLRKYRPVMRPYTQEVGSTDPEIKAHRREIVASWFQYALWAVRLK